MRQSTKVERFSKKQTTTTSTAAIDDAVAWLSEHMGFPAATRAQFEAKARRPARR